MNKFYAVLALLTITVGFQNCSPSNLNSGMGMGTDLSVGSGRSTSLSGGSLGIDLRAATLLEISNPLSSVAESESTLNDQKLIIDIEGGVIHVKAGDGSLIAERCLEQSIKHEIESVLQSSELCERQVTDKICAQRYEAGYATLIVNGVETSLGEKMDSCGSGMKDLCGESADAFRGIVKHIRSSWSTFECR